MLNESTSSRIAASPRALLQEELARRCGKNPRYSLRAFAKAMGISHTVLSLVMSGKRPLSKGAARKVADSLELGPAGRQALEGARRKGTVGVASSPESADPARFQQLPLDAFSVVSDWYHYAILSALELSGARYEARWLSRLLGVSEIEARVAMERLERLGLVEKGPTGRWRQSGRPIRIDNRESTSATRKFHRQLLEKAIHSLENDPIEQRDFSSLTLAIDPASLPYAQRRIREFRRELMAELEAMGQPKAVYQMTFQLYPATRVVEQEK